MPYKLNIGDGEHYLKWDGEALFIKGVVSLDSLSGLNANIGTITAGKIYGVRFYIGAGTNEDIYFMDSGIRLYDFGSRQIRLYKSGYEDLIWILGATYAQFGTTGELRLSGSKVRLSAAGRLFQFYTGGTFQLPTLTSAPTGHNGDLAFDDADEQTKLYTLGAWRHHVTYAGW